MGARLPPLVFRLALLVAIAVSSALLVDYYRPLPAFCDVGSGCSQIKASGYGKVLHVPVPLIGLLAFASLMAVSLVHNELARRITRILALVGGAVGLALLLVQGLVLHVFCKLCVAVDTSAVVAAASTFFWRDSEDTPWRTERWVWLSAMAVAVALPRVWSQLQPSPPVPDAIARMWEPGKINVVEFVDFQCPFCRALHPNLREVLGEYAGRVHLVRLNVPLPQHGEARYAARAYCCADEQGKGEEMADALFQSDDLRPAACERLAASLGLSLDEFRACVANPQTDAKIDAQTRIARGAGLAGLPTVWIGDEVIVGSADIQHVRAAFADAARGKSTRLPTAFLWAGFAAALAAVGAIAMRVRATPTLR